MTGRASGAVAPLNVGRPAFDDAGLFHGDGGNVVAQLTHVVETDARYYRHDRLADVGGIKPAAKADLHDCRIDPARMKWRNPMAVAASKNVIAG